MMLFFKPSSQISNDAAHWQCFERRSERRSRFGLSALALLSVLVSMLTLAPYAAAGEADVVKVKAKEGRGGVWRFAVSLRHDDKGWGHYANNWEVLSPDGKIIAVRALAHPHVDEQPFTRSLSGVKIPEGLTHVIIRARDSVHGYGGQIMQVDLDTGKAKIVKIAEDSKP